MTAIEILTELLDSLPAAHPERPGVIRAIEVLRYDLPRPAMLKHDDPVLAELRDLDRETIIDGGYLHGPETSEA